MNSYKVIARLVMSVFDSDVRSWRRWRSSPALGISAASAALAQRWPAMVRSGGGRWDPGPPWAWP